MEEDIKNKNFNKGDNKKYYRKSRSRPQRTDRPAEADASKHFNHVKTVKVKKLSEETVADINKDIERLEKEIDLEIKEIQSAKLSF